MAFQKAFLTDSLWSGEKKRVTLEGESILVFNIEGKFYAYEDKCAHKGVPLCEGKLAGNILTCPAHHWSYDACTGHGVNPGNCQLKVFPTKVEGDELWIDVGGAPDEKRSSEGAFFDWVGPVLTRSTLSSFIVSAIRECNPAVTVKEQASYLRILAPGKCVLRADIVSRLMHRPFQLPRDLEPAMPSFKGKYRVSDQEAVWEFGGEK